MKISQVQNFNIYKTQNIFQKNQTNKENITSKSKGIMPNAELILSFQGGKSLDLEKTIQQIDKYGQYPPEIRETALKTIKSGNPDNKTLIDIHKAKYADLYAFDTLEEIKLFFPEFEGVLSDSQVEIQKGSFMDDVKKGNIPYFDKDKDIAIQLLQMYWGEGISFSDFKNEFANKNIYGVFKKLNIPSLDKVYGHYLGFSDREKNDRFTQAQSNRAKGKEYAFEQREKREGRPLSEEHRAKISASLKKYYAENPDIALYRSEQQKEHFEKNPIQSEIFSQVVLRAWSQPEAKSVKKALSKHMKKKELSDAELTELLKGDKTQQAKLKEFWNKNVWAKKSFSTCMKKSWARQNFIAKHGLIYEPIYAIKPMPDKQVEKIKAELGENFKYIEDFIYALIPDERENSNHTTPEMELSKKITGTYFRNNPNESVHLANVLHIATLQSIIKIGKTKNLNEKDFGVLVYIARNLEKNANGLQMNYLNCINYCVQQGHKDWAKVFEESLNRSDTLWRNHNMDKIRAITSEFTKQYMPDSIMGFNE